MESLHFSVTRAVNDGIFKGLRITASGLCINVNKSHVLGVGVPLDIVRQGALRIGCEVMQTPFKYLGVMVGDHMSRYSAWSNTIQKVKVLSSKKNGVLGVSSFFALNRALLLKWVWRYLVQDGSLWYHIISAIYGSRLECHSRNTLSPWGVILQEVHQLASKGFNFHFHCKIRVGGGLNTRFWFDTWILDLPLNVRFHRLFALELDKDISVAAKWSAPSFDASFKRQVRDGVERNQWSALLHMLGTITLSSSSDRYFCDLNGDGAYRVKDIRSELDDLFLPSSAVATRWVNLVPIKVNIFAWRVSLDRLPTRATCFSLANWVRVFLKEFFVGGTFNGRRTHATKIESNEKEFESMHRYVKINSDVTNENLNVDTSDNDSSNDESGDDVKLDDINVDNMEVGDQDASVNVDHVDIFNLKTWDNISSNMIKVLVAEDSKRDKSIDKGFLNVDDTTGQELFDVTQVELKDLDLDIDDEFRVNGFSNAVNVAKKISLVMDINPLFIKKCGIRRERHFHEAFVEEDVMLSAEESLKLYDDDHLKSCCSRLESAIKNGDLYDINVNELYVKLSNSGICRKKLLKTEIDKVIVAVINVTRKAKWISTYSY
nr:hypothetical protein [Tanacetum cinerariifolium]